MAEAHPEIGLMLLATAAGLVLWWLAKEEPVWRWACLGILAWGLQGGVWLLERLSGFEAPFKPSDALLLIAVLTWTATLRQLRPIERPRLTLTLVLFLIAVIAGTLYAPPLRLPQMVWLADLLPFWLALPLLEAAMRGQASEARLVWGLGLLLKAGGSLALGWLNEAIGFVYFAWALGYILIGWGATSRPKTHASARLCWGLS